MKPGETDPLAETAYRTTAVLGHGSMGLVVEAEHIALGSRVAVKLLHVQLKDRPDLVDRMRVEAQVLGALAALRHPNIVAVTDFAVTPRGVPFFVMERLFGRTVAEERRLRGVLPLHEAIDIARQTLAGLAAVHKAGIVHRDIKAANLLLCDLAGRRTVKLLDFGIAKVLTSPAGGLRGPLPLRFPTAEGVTVGTPRYLSPEQASGKPVDARADLYAVGALLYSLVVGRGPFDELQGYEEMIHAHAARVPPPPSALSARPIPSKLDAVIMRALAKRPADRFATAEEFAAALLYLSVDDGGSARQARRFDTEPLPLPASSSSLPLWISAPTETDDAEPTVRSAQAKGARSLVLAALCALGWAVVVSLLLRRWVFH